jgi:pyruvate,water dikinase
LRRRIGRLRRPGFNLTLKNAQQWVALRERTKSIVVRGARLVDFLIPELGARLVASGYVERPEDLFFLTNEELDQGIRGESEQDAKERVARRRKEYERDRSILLPERFYGHPVPIEPEEHLGKGPILKGTPVSPGSVTGRARVILDPSRDAPIQPGEILVAPVTDAGWTPLFALATGLVVDMGSALSHGSTVAREYGLPAVVNVRSGTRSIRTGDLLAVNGSKGTVTILESVEA